jgi:hypothetical protein
MDNFKILHDTVGSKSKDLLCMGNRRLWCDIEVLMAVLMKFFSLWDMTPCRLVYSVSFDNLTLVWLRDMTLYHWVSGSRCLEGS